MGLLFGILLVLYLILYLVSAKRRNKEFQKLSAKEHPVKLLYPMAAVILERLPARYLGNGKEQIAAWMRSISVRENVEREVYLYRIRKVSMSLLVSGICLLLGFISGMTEKADLPVKQVQRPLHGEGMASYELEVTYRNHEEDLALTVEPQRLTQDQIRAMLKQAFEEIKPIVLGENPSQEQVSKPLQLITEYEGILISWDIEKLDSINYSGQIKARLEEHESRTVNLFATLSMEEVSVMFPFPICLIAPDLSAGEKLLQKILDAVEQENDRYERDVKLPDNIDGYPVSFHEKQEHHACLFLALAVLAAICVCLSYDQKLKNQVEKRKEQMMVDFSEIVSKLSLLYEAGLSIYGAFSRITAEYEKKQKKEADHYAYRELQLVLEKIHRGVGEAEAYAQFGRRCGLYSYMKLGNLLEQNLNKGTKGMKLLLKQEVEASFEERKRLARKKGEEAGTRILFPMILMMLVVIAIIAVPALLSVHM